MFKLRKIESLRHVEFECLTFSKFESLGVEVCKLEEFED